MPELQDLADWMGAAAVMTAADSGGGSFDEVLPLLYRKVAQANPGKPVPMASATATLEYRGHADVFDHHGEQDALRLFGFLCGRGLIDADPGPVPQQRCEATPFEATEIIRVDRPGLVAYRVDLGQRVTKGQPIADLIAMDGPEAFIARTPILAGTDGIVLSRSLRKYVTRGEGIAKIVGTVPLPPARATCSRTERVSPLPRARERVFCRGWRRVGGPMLDAPPRSRSPPPKPGEHPDAACQLAARTRACSSARHDAAQLGQPLEPPDRRIARLRPPAEIVENVLPMVGPHRDLVIRAARRLALALLARRSPRSAPPCRCRRPDARPRRTSRRWRRCRA